MFFLIVIVLVSCQNLTTRKDKINLRVTFLLIELKLISIKNLFLIEIFFDSNFEELITFKINNYIFDFMINIDLFKII